jgi:large subunit ribosomal protein L10
MASKISSSKKPKEKKAMSEMAVKASSSKEPKERKAIIDKQNAVKEMAAELKKRKVVVLLNLSKTPDKLVQQVRKRLKGKHGAYFQVAKLAIVKRALEQCKLPAALYADLNFPVAVIAVNDLSPYDISSMFMGNMLSVAAKPGDKAPFEIVIPAGETDMPPGPALTQLKQAGLNVKVDKGKIAISSDSVLAKEGAVLTKEKVGALQMLGIKPFKVGLTIWRAFDGKIVFNADVLGLSAEQLAEGLKNAVSQGFSMSINANYPTQSNISILLTGAMRQGKAIGIGSGAYSEGVMPELLAKAFSQGNALKAIEKKGG